jgi:hypothetical protein
MHELSPLEIRLECHKRLMNACLDFSQRVHDRRAISELYRYADVYLHVHFAMDGMHCATYRCLDFAKVSVGDGVKTLNDKVAPDVNQLAVFVAVGEISQRLSPVASAVRLQPLDSCNMRGVDALEPSSTLPKYETLCSVFDGELRLRLLDAGIEKCKLENEIIERTAQVVTNLTDPDTDAHRGCYMGLPDSNAKLQRLRIELGNKGILILPAERNDAVIQVNKVFLCPAYSLESALKAVRGHGKVS